MIAEFEKFLEAVRRETGVRDPVVSMVVHPRVIRQLYQEFVPLYVRNGDPLMKDRTELLGVTLHERRPL